MQCVECKKELEPESRFCNKCGARVESGLRCQSCNAEIQPDTNFCGNCGVKVAAAAAPVEDDEPLPESRARGKSALRHVMPEKKAAPQAGDAAQETKSVAGNDNARQSEPSDAQGLFELAKRQVEEEKTDEALKTLNKAIKLDSDNAEYYNLRGLVFFNKAVYGQALKNFSKAIELASDNADYYYNRAEVYRRSEDDQNAVAAFIDLDDLFGNYSYDGGELSIRDGNAREYYNSRSSNPNIQVANTLYILTKALENYDKAIELAPDSNADYYRGRAMIYGHNLIKYYSGAVKDIESAYALDPSDDLMEWLKREEGRLGGYKEGYKYKNILVRKN